MNLLSYSPEVAAAKADGKAIVALESTLISHGLPYPQNLECAQDLEARVRAKGAVPATIALMDGKICIGLSAEQLARLADPKSDVTKVSRRDFALVLSSGGMGATTVAGTMIAAHKAGIKVFATGGIGGVHRGAELDFDVSADLTELGRTPVAVVCAGAKSILDLPKTLEILETQGVGVLGYKTDEFPAFFTQQSGLSLSQRVDDAKAAAAAIQYQSVMGLETGMVIANPIPAEGALDPAEERIWIEKALAEAKESGISGKETTPFLLSRIRDLSEGRSLEANLLLIGNNTDLAAEIAVELVKLEQI